MDINLTLVVQMLVFAAFVWFTMKFVWPPLARAMEERQAKIADGLAQAERGRKELELAQHRAKDELKQAKADASEIIKKANWHADTIIEKAREDARSEALRQAQIAKEQLQQEINNARAALSKEVGQLAVAGAEKILGQVIDEKISSALLDKQIEEI